VSGRLKRHEKEALLDLEPWERCPYDLDTPTLVYFSSSPASVCLTSRFVQTMKHRPPLKITCQTFGKVEINSTTNSIVLRKVDFYCSQATASP
jgi:hypothetical protein